MPVILAKNNEDTLKYLQEVEEEAYPSQYRSIVDCQGVAEFKEYCEGNPKVWLFEGGYLIATRNEVVDLAAVKPVTIATLREILTVLKKYYKGRAVSLDAREGTSYKLLQYASRKKLLKVIDDTSYDWGGEVFHEMTLVF